MYQAETPSGLCKYKENEKSRVRFLLFVGLVLKYVHKVYRLVVVTGLIYGSFKAVFTLDFSSDQKKSTNCTKKACRFGGRKAAPRNRFKQAS